MKVKCQGQKSCLPTNFFKGAFSGAYLAGSAYVPFYYISLACVSLESMLARPTYK